VQSSLDQRQRFQQLFFPEGIAFDGSTFAGAAATATAFSYLRGVGTGNEGVVDLRPESWNQLDVWLRRLDGLRTAA